MTSGGNPPPEPAVTDGLRALGGLDIRKAFQSAPGREDRPPSSFMFSCCQAQLVASTGRIQGGEEHRPLLVVEAVTSVGGGSHTGGDGTTSPGRGEIQVKETAGPRNP